MKRLQRELFAHGEAETSSGAFYLRSVLPEVSLGPRSGRFSRSTKKGLVHASCLPNAAGAAPSPSGSGYSTAAMFGAHIRSGFSGMRHHRGGAAGGGSSSSSRLASRFVHMRRRSNLADSGKQHSISVDVSKQADSRHSGCIPVTSTSLDGTVPAAGSSPTNQVSCLYCLGRRT